MSEEQVIAQNYTRALFLKQITAAWSAAPASRPGVLGFPDAERPGRLLPPRRSFGLPGLKCSTCWAGLLRHPKWRGTARPYLPAPPLTPCHQPPPGEATEASVVTL